MGRCFTLGPNSIASLAGALMPLAGPGLIEGGRLESWNNGGGNLLLRARVLAREVHSIAVLSQSSTTCPFPVSLTVLGALVEQGCSGGIRVMELRTSRVPGSLELPAQRTRPLGKQCCSGGGYRAAPRRPGHYLQARTSGAESPLSSPPRVGG